MSDVLQSACAPVGGAPEFGAGVVTGQPGVVLQARGLSVRNAAGDVLVEGVDLAVPAGACVGVVGESGAGKTLTLRACLGLLPVGLQLQAQELSLAGTDMLPLVGASAGSLTTSARREQLALLLGTRVGFVPQNTMEYLHPLMRVREQMTDGYLTHHPQATRAQALERAGELLRAAGIADVERVLAAYPAQLSGGMRQRVNIATALMGEPALVVADEPTASLDTTVARQVIDLLSRLAREQGIAVVMVSHNLAMVHACCDELLVMREGRVVERGEATAVFSTPREAYTRMLVEAAPRIKATREEGASADELTAPAAPTAILEARDLSRDFGAVHAVQHVSLELREGRTLGVVGESGSGKSTLGEVLGGLQKPSAGTVLFDGADTASLRGSARKAFRRAVQYVFQDPVASVNPTFTVERALADPQRVLFSRSRKEAREASCEVLRRVGLDPALVMGRHASELSGGQAQRVAIARALLTRPRVLVCDECTSALDAAVQGQILDLLRSIQEETGCAILFISHDMAAVCRVAHEVLVMHNGQVVEHGPAAQVLEDPRDTYTRTLIRAAYEMPGEGAEQ